jgi:hypothetical protein
LFALLLSEGYGPPPNSLDANQVAFNALAGSSAADALFTLLGSASEGVGSTAASGGLFGALFGLGGDALSAGFDIVGGLF